MNADPISVQKIRAVILDIYGTLLKVGPPPADADERWENLWRDLLGEPARHSLQEFAIACEQLIAREHAAARFLGLAHPEVYWPAIAAEALPDLKRLPAKIRDEFLFRQAQLWHTVNLMAGVQEALSGFERRGMLLGLASNGQLYTLQELDAALAAEGLSRGIFKPELSFMSFEYGFSKPDPHVFRLLTTRLRALGIEASAILMVGDRLDNDLAPAQAQGWQTWQLVSVDGDGIACGDWSQLADRWTSANLRKSP